LKNPQEQAGPATHAKDFQEMTRLRYVCGTVAYHIKTSGSG
jgi:hypothetical protein